MQYLLFINYFSGLKHNSIYNHLNEVVESISQLYEEENLDSPSEYIITEQTFAEHFRVHDDFEETLPNGTWYHLQCFPVFEKPDRKK